MEDIIKTKLELLFGITEAITGASEQAIRSPLRDRHIALARNIVGCILYKEFGLTVKKTAKLINRDHSSVCYYDKNFDGNFEFDPEFREAYTNIAETFWGNYIKAERNDIDLQVTQLQSLINKLEAKKQSLTKIF
jgi:hypothetical protein